MGRREQRALKQGSQERHKAGVQLLGKCDAEKNRGRLRDVPPQVICYTHDGMIDAPLIIQFIFFHDFSLWSSPSRLKDLIDKSSLFIYKQSQRTFGSTLEGVKYETLKSIEGGDDHSGGQTYVFSTVNAFPQHLSYDLVSPNHPVAVPIIGSSGMPSHTIVLPFQPLVLTVEYSILS